MFRNPLYFFSFIGGMGWRALRKPSLSPSLRHWHSVFYYPAIIRREQERLISLFGNAYRDYCRTGPSFIPSLSLLKPAHATYSVNPATFTHNIFDALWFIGIFEFISGLHDAGILPVWFFIP